jgi:hypothetical protein
MSNLNTTLVIGLVASCVLSCGQRAEITAKTVGTAPTAGDALPADASEVLSSNSDNSSSDASVAEPAQDDPTQPTSEANPGIQKTEPIALTQEFLSGTITDIVNEFTVNHTEVKTNYVLARETTMVPTERQFTQLVRTAKSESFTQGRTGAEKETFNGAPINDSVILAKPADNGSVNVFVNGSFWTEFEVKEAREVKFKQKLPNNPVIVINYTSGATPLLDTFQLTKTPDAATVKVTVNGKEVTSTEYTIEGGTKIKFKAKPADGASIAVSYKEVVAMPKSFVVDASAVADSIKLYVNTVERPGTYNSTTGEVVFTTAPEEGTTVLIKYKLVVAGNPITKFPLTTQWGGVKKLTGYDTDTGAAVGVSYADNTLTLDPKFFVVGRKITVKYLDESNNPSGFSLPMKPLEGSVGVKLHSAEGSEIPCLASEHTVADAVLTLSCDLVDAKTVIVSYKSEISPHDTFTLPGVSDPEKAKWSVWINGVLTINFSRDGATIKINEPLGPASKILVKAEMQ